MKSRTVAFRIVLLTAVISSSSVVFSLAQTSAGTPEISPARELVIRLVAAKTEAERSTILAENLTVDRKAIIPLIIDEAERQNGSAAPTEVERIAGLGLEFAQTEGDKREIARAWLAIGNAQTQSSVKLGSYEKGIAAANDTSANDIAAQLFMAIAQLQDSFSKRMELYKLAVAAAEKHSDKRVLSGLLSRIGNILKQMGDYDAARDYHARALEIKRSMNDILGVATTISNIGVTYGIQGDMRRALRNFKESLSILETLNEKDSPLIVQRKARDLRNIGIVYQTMGDSVQAMDYYFKSVKLSEAANYADGVYGAEFQIASLQNQLGNYQLAREAMRRGAGVEDDSEIPSEMMGLLGGSYIGEGRYDKGIEAYKKQLADVEENGGVADLADCLRSLGNFHLLTHDWKTAEELYRRAREIGESSKNDSSILRSLIGITRAKLGAFEYRSALDVANEARLYRDKLQASPPELEILTGLAYEGLKEPRLAQEHFDSAITIFEDLRRSSSPSDEQDGYFNATLPYHLMVESLVGTSKFGDAFTFAERAKARALLDVLASGKINIERSMTPGEKETERDLKSDLVALGAQIRSLQGEKVLDPKRLSELEKQLSDKRTEYTLFRNKMYRSHPELRVQRGEMKPITQKEIAELLPSPGTAVVEFVVGENKTFLFVIAKDETRRVSLKVFTADVESGTLAKYVEDLRSKIAAGDLGFQDRSRALYNLLLRPAATELAGKTNVIIIPDSSLWELPFQTLLNERGKYLVEQASISYAPSLTALNAMSRESRSRKVGGNLELLALGNPITAKETRDHVRRVFMGEGLEPIPEAERLVTELGKLYGPGRSKIFTGSAASEGVAKSEAPKYRVVQFATHGLLNNASPMYSHLVLARNDSDPTEDGLLEAWELQDLNLNADMVILSACDTARGRLSSGEGIIGMTWATFIAGAPTTVSSQWKVESSSTTELMLEFHRQMLAKTKVSKSEALRQAQLKLLRSVKYRHPSYWGAWVLIGDGS